MNRFSMVIQYVVRFWLFMEYFLTGGIRSAALVAGTSVAFWVFLTEYFMAERFPSWGGPWEYFFLIPAIGLPAALSAIGVWRMEANRPAAAPLAFPREMKVPVRDWIAMLQEAGDYCQGWLPGSFLRWQARLLRRYSGDQSATVTIAEIPRVWRRRRRHVLAHFWFPALLLVLASPLPTPVMETLALILSNRPPDAQQIEAFRAYSDQHEPLTNKAGEFNFSDPNQFGQGFLRIVVPDFPRVYRQVRAICGGESPGCKIGPGPRGPFAPVLWQPLRGGIVEVHFVRNASGALSLGMELKVFQTDGVTEVSGSGLVTVN